MVPAARMGRKNSGIMLIENGRYTHYKGKEYEVIGMAKHSETLEDMVVYRQLYGEFGLWVRPASMWNEVVNVDGKEVKRFEFLGFQLGPGGASGR